MTSHLPPKLKIVRTGSLVRGTVEAPAGYIWASDQVHELVADGRGGADVTRGVRSELKRRMAYGIEPCTQLDCDWCNNVE